METHVLLLVVRATAPVTIEAPTSSFLDLNSWPFVFGRLGGFSSLGEKRRACD
jgi:hypothetical protein